jgi:G3E family GTPase
VIWKAGRLEGWKKGLFQGVHMLFEDKPDRDWKPDEVRKSQMVFIGRNLDRAELNAGFRRCLT